MQQLVENIPAVVLSHSFILKKKHKSPHRLSHWRPVALTERLSVVQHKNCLLQAEEVESLDQTAAHSQTRRRTNAPSAASTPLSQPPGAPRRESISHTCWSPERLRRENTHRRRVTAWALLPKQFRPGGSVSGVLVLTGRTCWDWDKGHRGASLWTISTCGWHDENVNAMCWIGRDFTLKPWWIRRNLDRDVRVNSNTNL